MQTFAVHDWTSAPCAFVDPHSSTILHSWYTPFSSPRMTSHPGAPITIDASPSIACQRITTHLAIQSTQAQRSHSARRLDVLSKWNPFFSGVHLLPRRFRMLQIHHRG